MKLSHIQLSLSVIVFSTIIMSCTPDKTAALEEMKKTPGINLEFMDKEVSPKDDFFRYVNGSWLDKTEIPDDRSSWGGFNELRKKTDADALAILSSAMSDSKELKIEIIPGSDQEKAVHLFQTIMDTASRDKQGLDPLRPYLAKIDAISSVSDLQDLLVEMEPTGGIGFFGFNVRADTKNSNVNSGYLGSGGLGLPDRDYYIKDDDDSKEKRDLYVAHVSRMLEHLGESEEQAQSQAKQILAFETKLAEPRMDKVDRRDARKRYNPKSIADLQEMVPSINWTEYFKGLGAEGLDTVIVSDVKYLSSLQNIFDEGNISDWKSYLRWSIFNNSAGMLSSELETANWEFYGKDLRGAKKQRPKDEVALQTLNRTIGEALGKLYVDKQFPPEAKVKAEKMIANVILAYEIRINKLDWMSEETKAKAIEKLKQQR